MTPKIVHTATNCDDTGRITTIEIKVKGPDINTEEDGYTLSANVSSAFYKTFFPANIPYKTLKIELNPKRKGILDISITLPKNNEDGQERTLTHCDLGNFLCNFQKTIDGTSIV